MGTSSKGDNQGQDLQEFLQQVLVMLSDASGEGDHVHSPRQAAIEPIRCSWQWMSVIASERGSRLMVGAMAMD